MTNLAGREYWERSFDGLALKPALEDDPVRVWIKRHVGPGSGDCLEIGCYPGRYLSIFGDLGYRLHGIDQDRRTAKELPEWLSARGYDVGEFYEMDVCAFRSRGAAAYDVVCSFGFIEHFTDWRNVLIKHAEIVKDGGCLIVSVPNFRGVVQRVLHLLLDRDNYRRHHIPSMDPRLWGDIVSRMDFEIIFCGYFGGFDFWVDRGDRNCFQRKVLRVTMRHKGLVAKMFGYDNMAVAPYCGLVARKRRKVP